MTFLFYYRAKMALICNSSKDLQSRYKLKNNYLYTGMNFIWKLTKNVYNGQCFLHCAHCVQCMKVVLSVIQFDWCKIWIKGVFLLISVWSRKKTNTTSKYLSCRLNLNDKHSKHTFWICSNVNETKQIESNAITRHTNWMGFDVWMCVFFPYSAVSFTHIIVICRHRIRISFYRIVVNE